VFFFFAHKKERSNVHTQQTLSHMSDVSLSFYCYLCRHHCNPSCYCLLICSSLFHDSSLTLTWQDETIICPGARWAWPESECCREQAMSLMRGAAAAMPSKRYLRRVVARDAATCNGWPAFPIVAGARARSLAASGRLTRPDVHTYMQTNTRTHLKKTRARTTYVRTPTSQWLASAEPRKPCSRLLRDIRLHIGDDTFSAASSACEKTVRQ